MTRLAAAFVLAVLATLAGGGCGSSEPTNGPKETITEEQKQQVIDLQQQRQKEWSGTKKAQGN